MLRIKLVAIGIGIAICVWAGRELMLASKASGKPQTISCANLLSKGYGDNAHIILTDYVPSVSGFVYEGTSESGPYKKVYLPALEKDGPWHRKAIEAAGESGDLRKIPRPDDVRLLLKFKNLRDENALDKALTDTLEGTITNSIDSLSADEKKFLQQGYPTIDTDKCIIFEIGRKPADGATAMLGMAGGVVLGLGGLAWLASPLLRRRGAQLPPPPPPITLNQPQPTLSTPPPIDDKNPYRG